MTDPGPSPSFPTLARALRGWRSADEAFRAARSRAERGRAMSRQLEARRAVHRISEIELSIPPSLRAMLVAEGVWSAAEALDRLAAVDFAARALALGALVPVLAGADLDRALRMADRPGWGDDERWERDPGLIEALRARVASSNLHEEAGGAAAPSSGPALREGDVTLLAILRACRGADEDGWIASSFAAAIEYVTSDLQPEHAAELARDRAHPLFLELRSALLARDRDLWSKPWFSSVFDPDERRAHLGRVLARREDATGAPSDRFEGLLDVAERLRGAQRAEVLGWALAARRAGAPFELTADLARVAELADSRQRSDLLAEIAAQPDASAAGLAPERRPRATAEPRAVAEDRPLHDRAAAFASLEAWAAAWPELSAATRDELSPRIERAVETILAEDARDDDALCAIAERLPERLLERIWTARAEASAYRHALALFERRFCELALAGSDHHRHVLHFVQALGDDDALVAYARTLAGPDAEASPA